MANFFAELKRRHIYRVAAAYAVVAWVLLQIVNNISPGLSLPNWVVTSVIVVLAVGFPIALIFAWIHQLAPADGVAPAVKTGRLDWVLIGALVVVIALVSYQQFSFLPGARTAQQPNVPSGAISIAVLPFANLSGDAGQEFFSDGMTEEITAALAKVQSVRMVGRSSAFQFKGQNRDLRAIGQALGANYLIDGSVRKVGDQVRITAQLVQADNGVSVWTDSYDREMKNIFATQSDIATAIAGALRVPLGLQQGESLVANRTADVESYEQYLRARALFRARALDDAVAILEPLVMRDPSYAPAWSLLAGAYVPVLNTNPEQRAIRAQKLDMVAREAIRLDPRSALAYAALADRDSGLGRWVAAEDGFLKALALDPNEPDVLNRYSTRLGVTGRIRESLALKEKLYTLEPFVPTYNLNRARFMITGGNAQDAIAILEKIAPQNPLLARAYATEGRYREAADAVLATPQQDFGGPACSPRLCLDRRAIEDAARLLRSAPQQVASPNLLPALPPPLNFVYLHIGAFDLVLIDPKDLASVGFGGSALDVLWQREAAPLRKTERFKQFVREAGLVDYWRAKGWADACHAVGANDFVCE